MICICLFYLWYHRKNAIMSTRISSGLSTWSPFCKKEKKKTSKYKIFFFVIWWEIFSRDFLILFLSQKKGKSYLEGHLPRFAASHFSYVEKGKKKHPKKYQCKIGEIPEIKKIQIFCFFFFFKKKFKSWKCGILLFHVFHYINSLPPNVDLQSVSVQCEWIGIVSDPGLDQDGACYIVSTDRDRASFLLDWVLRSGRLHRKWRQSDRHRGDRCRGQGRPRPFQHHPSCHQLGPVRQQPVDQDLDQSRNVQVQFIHIQ